MGSDGHIRFYDGEKVDQILESVQFKYQIRDKISFPGYECKFTVNGKSCYLIYWDNIGLYFRFWLWVKRLFGNRFYRSSQNTWEEMWWFDSLRECEYWYKEIKERCDKEAILVEDQEVWT